MEKEEGHWGGVWPFIYYPGQTQADIYLPSLLH